MAPMLTAQCCVFGVLIAALVSLAFSTTAPPWTHIDLALKWLLRNSLEYLTGSGSSLQDERWRKSAEERTSLIKYAAFGGILIFLFPLHVLSGSELLIDSVWALADAMRHFLADTFPNYIHFAANDWRLSAFELWEVCVLFWTITVVANVTVIDYIDLSRARGADLGKVFSEAGRAGLIKVVVVLIGTLILIILEDGLLRLGFESSIIFIILCFDIRFARAYKKLGKAGTALQFFEVMILIDVPVLIAFCLLILFLITGQLRGYESHWSSSFVAGASALNLVFTSGSILIMKTAHSYRKV